MSCRRSVPSAAYSRATGALPGPAPAATARMARTDITCSTLAPLLSRTDLLALRICDPAVGEGAYLIEIVRVLGEALAARGMPLDRARRLVAERCVHGVDIDARAVAAAHVAVESFVGARVPALREHLRVGDALAIDWKVRFDALVGNPPYVRQELLANKAAINQTDANGITPLLMAIVNNRVAVAKLLIEQGADIHAVDWYGRTPLWAAVETRNMDVDNATFVNSIDRESMLDVIRILLERGANVNARVWSESGKDGRGEWRTPLSMARRHGYDAVVALLRAAGAQE